MTAAPPFESIAQLPDAFRTPVRNLVLACADTKLLLGYHYGEWTFGPPALEAAVTCCSLAQSEFGHVRLLHGTLRAAFGDSPDDLVERRAPADYASISFLHRPIAGWPGLVAMNYVIDFALSRVLESLAGSRFKPLRSGMEKMLDEERYHAHHGRGWLRALARGPADTRDALGARLTDALAATRLWFGPPDEPEDLLLVAEGVKRRSNDDIFSDVAHIVSTEAESAGVVVHRSAANFAGWDATTRRTPGDGPDAEIVDRLRGTRNDIFKVA